MGKIFSVPKDSFWHNMMIINRSVCKLVAVIFFLELVAVIGYVIMYLIPGFQFTGNQLIRMSVLLGSFFITALFYNYIAADSEIVKGKDKGMFLIKGKIDYLKLIIIIMVVGAFLWFVIRLVLSIYGINIL